MNSNKTIILFLLMALFIPINAFALLDTPTNVSATKGIYSDRVEISWDSVVGANYYRIVKSTASSGTYLTLTDTPALSYSDTSVTPGVTYYYKVEALYKVGTTANDMSGLSSYVSGYAYAPPCDSPPSLSVPSTSTGTYTVSWGASATGGVTYILEEATDSAFTSPEPIFSGTSLSAIITKVASGTFYYRVKAIKNNYSDSSYFQSGTVCVVTVNPASYFSILTLDDTFGGSDPDTPLFTRNQFNDNDYVSESETYLWRGIVTHALYPVEFYTQQSSDNMGAISIRPDADVFKMATDNRKPLILIHGWQGDVGIHQNQEELNKIEQLGETYWDNFIQFYNMPESGLKSKYRLYIYHYPSYKHVTFNARALSNLLYNNEYIRSYIAKSADNNIAIVAHSMGGLVARSLIEEHLNDTSNAFSKKGVDFLEKLITVATPHHGSPGSILWWTESTPRWDTSSFAPLKKDYFSPGTQDLYWDDYDGIFTPLFNKGVTLLDAQVILFPSYNIDVDNSGRISENSAFDSYYRDQLLPYNSSALERPYKAYWLKGDASLTLFSNVYKYPNPWLSRLNANYKINKSIYAEKYVFVSGYNELYGSINNNLNDNIYYTIPDNLVRNMGYMNDGGTVPLTSSSLDFSKTNSIASLSRSGISLYKDFIDNPTSVIAYKYGTADTDIDGIPRVIFKDYDHDRMLNGAYDTKPSDITKLDRRVAFKNDYIAQLYQEQSGLSHAAYLIDIAAMDTNTKLRFEPVFNVLSRHLLGTYSTTTVTSSISGSGGTISPSGIQTVLTGGKATFQITPNCGYQPVVTGSCNGTLTGNTYTTATVSQPCTVSVSFSGSSCSLLGKLIKKLTNGPVSGATVFADSLTGGERYVPDSDEQKTTTDAQGYFSLDVTSINPFILVSTGGVDTLTGLDAISMYAPPDARNITPLTSLVAMDSSGTVKAKIEALLAGNGYDTDISTTTTQAAMLLTKAVVFTVQSLTSSISANSSGIISIPQMATIQAQIIQNITAELAKTNVSADNIATPSSLKALLQSSISNVITALASNGVTFADSTASSIAISSDAVDAATNFVGFTSALTSPANTLNLAQESTYVTEATRSYYENMLNTTTTTVLPSITVSQDPYSFFQALTPKNKSIAVGNYGVLALKPDGTVWKSSSGDESYTQIVGIDNIISISSGAYHSLALRNDGTVWAWGENFVGQLGNEITGYSQNPVKISGLTNAIAVFALFNTSFVIKTDGTVWGWGYNGSGQLVSGGVTNITNPTQLTWIANIVDIASQYGNDFVALKNDGTVWWRNWRNNYQISQNESLSRIISISVADNCHALRNDGTIWQETGVCDTTYPYKVGQITNALSLSGRNVLLKNGTVFKLDVDTLDQITSLSGITAIEGDYAIKNDGTLWRSPGSASISSPVQITGHPDYIKVIGGYGFTLGLKSDGTVWAWGDNSSGQLGDGTNVSRATPAQVSGLSNISEIAVGSSHVLARQSNGTVWGWGNNASGQLGDGTTTNRLTPYMFSSLTGAMSIAAAGSSSYAVLGNGTVQAWGDNSYGQLGDGSTAARQAPVTISGLSNVKRIFAGEGRTFAQLNSGTVMGWGQNAYYGSLGDGTTTSRLVPGLVNGISGVTNIGILWDKTIALIQDGSSWCWGFCNGVFAETPHPTAGIVKNFTSLSCGGSSCLATTNSGDVWASDSFSVFNRVSNISGAVSVAALPYSTNYVIRNDNSLWSWGGWQTASLLSSASQVRGFTFRSQNPPQITQFSIPATTGTSTVPVSMTVTGDVPVSAYCLSQINNIDGCNWQSTAPTQFTFSGPVLNAAASIPLELYGWVKDANGVISNTATAKGILASCQIYSVSINNFYSGYGYGAIVPNSKQSMCGGENLRTYVIPSDQSIIENITLDTQTFSVPNPKRFENIISNISANHTLTASFDSETSTLGRISGTVKDISGTPISGVPVSAVTLLSGYGYNQHSSTTSQPDGHYFMRVAAGSYSIRFDTYGLDFAEQWYNNQPTSATATSVSVANGSIISNVNATLSLGGRISGRVTNESGAGIKGVRVSAIPQNNSTYSKDAITQDDGSYILQGLSAGNYNILFDGNNAGYVSQRYNNKPSNFISNDNVTVTLGTTVSNINAVLQMGGGVSGRVTNVDGVGIQHVGVYVFTSDYNYSGYCSSASDGTYIIQGLPAGSYQVKFDPSVSDTSYTRQSYNNKPYNSPDPVAVTVPNITPHIDAVLLLGGTISGRVTDSAGSGLSGVTIYSYEISDRQEYCYGYCSGSVKTVTSQADGTYSISGLPVGKIGLQFSKTGFVSNYYNNKLTYINADYLVVSSGATITASTTVLQAGGGVSGKVTNSSGAGIAGITVWLYKSTGTQYISYKSATTLADGTYTVTNIPPGTYKVYFSRGSTGYVSQWYPSIVAVASGTTLSGIDTVLSMGVSISGKVTNQTGGLLQNISVQLVNMAGGTVSNVNSAADGTYTISGVVPGTYKLRFSGNNTGYVTQWYNGKTYSAADILTVTAGVALTGIDSILIPGETISGKVSDSSGSGLQNVSVALVPVGGGDSYGVSTGSDGTYQIRGVPEGSYKVSFGALSNPTYIPKWYDNKQTSALADAVQVTVGTPVNNINAILALGARISGRVTNAAGEALICRVYAYSSVDSTTAIAQVVTAIDGYYTLSGLPDGGYKIRFDASGTGYTGQYYNGKGTFDTAETVTIVSGSNITNINAALYPITSACGTSHGSSFAASPAVNLCATGYTASVLNTTSSGWSWTCTDNTSGATSQCNAYTNFSITNLNGTWSTHGLVAGDAPDWFGWWRQNISIQDNSGTVTGYMESPNNSYPDKSISNTGALMTTDGIITVPAMNPSLHGVINKSKDFIVYTATSTTNPASRNIELWMKKSGTFSTADMAGTWYMHYLMTGDGTNTNLWSYGTAVCDSSGACLLSSQGRSDGATPSPSSKTFSVAVDGIITITGSSYHGTMSSDKSVVVFTVNDQMNSLPAYGMGIMTRSGATFTQADLAGNWTYHVLRAKDAGNAWIYGTATIDTAGKTTFTSTKRSDGTSTLVDTGNDTSSISTSGVITSSNSSIHGVMTPGKDISIMTMNSGAAGEVSLWIGVKRDSSIAGCGLSNGGIFTVAPTANLCATGYTASALNTTSSGWGWTCSNGSGTPATCSANIQTYTTTVTVTGENGTVSCTSPTKHGATSTCTITPGTGYKLDTLTDNLVDKKTAVVNGIYSIPNVIANHDIRVTFADGALPTVSTFTVPDRSKKLLIYATLSATDNIGVAQWCIVQGTVSTPCLWQAYPPTPPVAFTFPAGTIDGSYTLSAFAKDAKGNISLPLSRIVDIDTTPPTFTVTPTNNTTKRDSVYLSGACEANSTITAIVANIQPQSVPCLSSKWGMTVTGLHQGVNLVQVSGTDLAGNSTTKVVRVNRQ